MSTARNERLTEKGVKSKSGTAQPNPDAAPRHCQRILRRQEPVRLLALGHGAPDCKRIANGDTSNGGSARMTTNTNPQVSACLRIVTYARDHPGDDS
ncbi:MAG: hypothetical protein QOG50_1972 [Actinomycetota bacterium]|nr:hypothetical protein [Actinomycetota bacterium]